MKILSKILLLSFMFFCMASSKAFLPNVKKSANTNKKEPSPRFCIHLGADSANIGDTVVQFRMYGQMYCFIIHDGLYPVPMQNLKHCDISAAGYQPAANLTPSSTPQVMGLYLCSKDGDACKIGFESINTIPGQIILVNKCLNYQVEVKQNKCYRFNMDKKDLLIHSGKRFKLVVYENQNYSCQPGEFGIAGGKKKVTSVTAQMLANNTIRR